MIAIILNTTHTFNSFNPFVELYLNIAPYSLKIDLKYFCECSNLKAIHLEKLIGSEVEFDFISPTNKSMLDSASSFKFDNTYYQRLTFDFKYILKNKKEIKFYKITRKELYFDKIIYYSNKNSHKQYFNEPNLFLDLYAMEELVSTIQINDQNTFNLCLLNDIHILRSPKHEYDQFFEMNYDYIDCTIDFRINPYEFNEIYALRTVKKDKIKKLYESFKRRFDPYYNISDDDLNRELLARKENLTYKNI